MLRYVIKITGHGFLPALFIALCYGTSALAQDFIKQDQIKAAYIYNLLKFTRWPDTNSQPDSTSLHVCISGAPNDIAKILAAELRGRTIQKRTLTVSYIPEFLDSPDEQTINSLVNCQLLYLGNMTEKQEQYLTEFGLLHSVVTVSDRINFAQRNGMVELKIDTIEHKILLVINLAISQKADIVFSSKLLQLAELIERQQ